MRLILDRHWQNAFEVYMMKALTRLGLSADSLEAQQTRHLIRLSHGDMFAGLTLGPGDHLSIQLEVLRDYHYLLSWPEMLVKYGALGPALSASELSALGVAACAEAALRLLASTGHG